MTYEVKYFNMDSREPRSVVTTIRDSCTPNTGTGEGGVVVDVAPLFPDHNAWRVAISPVLTYTTASFKDSSGQYVSGWTGTAFASSALYTVYNAEEAFGTTIGRDWHSAHAAGSQSDVYIGRLGTDGSIPLTAGIVKGQNGGVTAYDYILQVSSDTTDGFDGTWTDVGGTRTYTPAFTEPLVPQA